MFIPVVLFTQLIAAPQGVDRLVAAADANYLAVRSELLADTTFMAELAASSRDSWERQAHAEILLAHREHPDLARTFARPSSLIPENYLKNRLARPMPYKSLARAPEAAAPFLFELWFRAEAMGGISTLDDFPASVSIERRRALIAEELASLRSAILHVVAESGHPLAGHLAISVIDDSADAELRAAAVRALGKSRSPLARDRLERVLRADDVDLAVFAALGLGALGEIDALVRIASSSAHSAVRVAALRGLRPGVGGLREAIERAAQDPAMIDAVVEVLPALAGKDPSLLEAKLRPEVRARVEQRIAWSAARRPQK